MTVPDSNHYTMLHGETPEVKSALRTFLATGEREPAVAWPPKGFAVC